MMATKESKESIRQTATDQRADIVSLGGELRKGVNVLNTSDPKNPAPNPFVQAQNQAVAQNQPASANTQGQANESKD
jgi:hypothetical protein